MIDEFNTSVNEQLDDENFYVEELQGITYLDDEEEVDPLGRNEEQRRALTPTDAEYGDLTGTLIMEADEMGETEEAVDKYIGAQLQLEVDGELQRATITERATDASGNKVGKAHNNPLFDTREFLVKFPDQSVRWHMVNQIVEAIYSQVDDEG